MYRTSRVKTKVLNLGWVSLLTILTVYFLYHAFNGERGIIAFIRLSKQTHKIQAELDNVRVERINLEHKVNLMRSDSLDLDLLDEQARKVLGYSKKGEVVYFLNRD